MLADRGVATYATTVAKIEAGDRAVRLDEAVAIADIFGMSLDVFLGRNQSPERELADLLRSLQATARQATEFATASSAALRDRSAELAAFQFGERDALVADTNAACDALTQAAVALRKVLQIKTSDDMQAFFDTFFDELANRVTE